MSYIGYTKSAYYIHLISLQRSLVFPIIIKTSLKQKLTSNLQSSMPIMNGFEATRCIRQLEAVRCRSTASEEEQDTSTIAARLAALPYDIPTGLIPTLNNGSAPFIKPRPSPTYTPSLIIALTGLASQQDQSDAFSSGVDLFMTKPVSFKEVGKLLDNWEANSPEERWDESSDGGDEMGAGAEA